MTVVMLDKKPFDKEMRAIWREVDAIEAAFVRYVDYLDVVHGEPEDVYDIAEADPFYKYLLEQELNNDRKMSEVSQKYGYELNTQSSQGRAANSYQRMGDNMTTIHTVKNSKHLLIPDAHACPDEDLRRFEWLGKLILDEQPDVIIDIGDWWDMPSLSSYDKGTKTFEGKRYKKDIEAGHEADALAFGGIIRYNEQQRRNKHRQYSPLIVRTRGNHEARISRAVEHQAELEGVLGLHDLDHRFGNALNIVESPFMEPVFVDGIAYCHYFASGVMGRPISRANLLLQKQFMSCTAGHLHARDWAEATRADGTRIQGLICGSFHDPVHSSHYANHQSQGLWWDGVHIKRSVNDGDYDREEISVKRLEERYG